MGAGRRWVEGRWRLGGMLWQCSPSLLEGHQVLVRSRTRAGELEAAGSLLGRKYFSAKGVSCSGSNPAARHWLGDLQSALQDRQHLPRMGKHPAAACTGQAPEGGEMAPLHGISSEAQPIAMLSCNHLAHNKNQRKEKRMPRPRGSASSGTNPFSQEGRDLTSSQSQQVPKSILWDHLVL